MANRLPPMTRMLSTSASRPSFAVAGMRADKVVTTATGGSGADSTVLSASMAEASLKAKAAYRTALRDIPDMRRNFTIMEDAQYVTAVIRDNFERHRMVSDPKIVDMLVFKASQELREIREQWKSRHHVYSYIARFAEKKLREDLAERAMDTNSSGRREDMLRQWRERGLVPTEIVTWPMFTRWRAEEDAKFRVFAVENKLFSEEQLDRNEKAASGCTIM